MTQQLYSLALLSPTAYCLYCYFPPFSLLQKRDAVLPFCLFVSLHLKSQSLIPWLSAVSIDTQPVCFVRPTVRLALKDRWDLGQTHFWLLLLEDKCSAGQCVGLRTTGRHIYFQPFTFLIQHLHNRNALPYFCVKPCITSFLSNGLFSS